MPELAALGRTLALVAVLSSPAFAHAVPVLDVDMTPTPNFAINAGLSTRVLEQTYTAGTGGLLTGIEFFYQRIAADNSPTGTGAPTPSAVTLFVGLGAAFLPTNQLNAFQLTLPVATSATTFFVDVSAANLLLAPGTSFIVGWQGTGSNADTYPRILATQVPLSQGVRDYNTLTGDLGQSILSPAIRSYVESAPPTPVPEPSSLALFGLAAIVLVARTLRPGT